MDNLSFEMPTIDHVWSYLATIPNINRGGCGFAAYSIYLWFKENDQLPEDFEIVYFHGGAFDSAEDEQYRENLAFLEGAGEYATSCMHAVVYMNGKYYDSRGEFNQHNKYDYKLSVKADKVDKFMRRSLLEESEWNWAFDRDMWIPEMEEQIGIEFNLHEQLT